MQRTPTDKISDARPNNKSSIEKKREYKRQWHIKNRDKVIDKAVKWNKENPEKRRLITAKYRVSNKEAISYKNKKYRMEYRRLVIEHYSGGSNSCKCCGENIQEFLTIDHINGGGNKHREKINLRGGHHFYFWLKQNNYPDGYQVLCYNCNMAKGSNGICPHQEQTVEEL